MKPDESKIQNPKSKKQNPKLPALLGLLLVCLSYASGEGVRPLPEGSARGLTPSGDTTGKSTIQNPQSKIPDVPEQPFSFGLEADGNSSYVWRGIVEDPDPVFQPSLWLSGYDFTLTGWGNLALGPNAGPNRFNELDLTLGYARTIGDLSLEPSLAFYLYPADMGSSTGEASLRLAYPVGPISLFTTHTFDVLAYPGAYFGTAGVGLDRDLIPWISLAAELALGWASAGFNEAYLDVHRTTLSLVQCDVGVTFDVLGLFYVRPHVTGARLIDPALSAASGSPWPASAGLAVGREF